MFASLAAIAIAYLIGSVPVAYLAARAAGGVDLRERGSGNIGASNVGESISRQLMIIVGIAQIAQGLGAVLIARVFDAGDGVQAASGVAAVLANDWNPWLRFAGGRGIGTTIGVLLALSPWALGAFVALAVAGAIVRMVPQGMALALIAMPFAAAIGGDERAIVVCCALLASIALAKRVLANSAPDASSPRPDVWLWRLIFDRDVRDRDAWVRRDTTGSPQRRGDAEIDL